MNIFISAGDPSGDRNAAAVVKQLKIDFPEALITGLGGPAMTREGFVSRFPFEKFNCMGYSDVIKQLPFLLKAQKEFVKIIHEEIPDILICVDYSGFNLTLMKEAHSLGIPVLWYIAPMIWARKKKKYSNLFAKYVAHVACILPFETTHWKPFLTCVSYVGSPLLEGKNMPHIPQRKSLDPTAPFTLALVPGSREGEVRFLLPTMLESVQELRVLFPQMRVLVSKTEYLPEGVYQNAVVQRCELFRGELMDLLHQSDLALVTSGTATLQAALAQVPHLILYKTTQLNALIGGFIIRRIGYCGLPNLMAKNPPIVPELLQHNACPERIVPLVRQLVEDPVHYRAQYEKLAEMRAQFGDKQPAIEISALVQKLITPKNERK